MKIYHMADLHLGKKLLGYPLILEQEYILKQQILPFIKKEKPDAVLISGDVFDTAVANIEAIALFDSFLEELVQYCKKVFIISGNHDSAQRLAFGQGLLSSANVHISPVYNNNVKPITMQDNWGNINFYLLPFIKPPTVRPFFPEEKIENHADALRIAIKAFNVNENERNILLAHQFVTNAEKAGSEDMSVGGAENVPASVFKEFDYVALGHIHKPQTIKINEEHTSILRYSGSPYCYSFSEANTQKQHTLINVNDKGSIEITTSPIIPRNKLVNLKGTYQELMSKSYYDNLDLDDYYSITLTDSEAIANVLQRMLTVYPNILSFAYNNERTKTQATLEYSEKAENFMPLDWVKELYQKQNNVELSEEQLTWINPLIEKIWEDEK